VKKKKEIQKKEKKRKKAGVPWGRRETGEPAPQIGIGCFRVLAMGRARALARNKDPPGGKTRKKSEERKKKGKKKEDQQPAVTSWAVGAFGKGRRARWTREIGEKAWGTGVEVRQQRKVGANRYLVENQAKGDAGERGGTWRGWQGKKKSDRT